MANSSAGNHKVHGIVKILAVVLCLLSIIYGLVKGGNSEVCYQMENSFNRKISDASQIEKLGKTVGNDNIILTADIHITNKDFKIGTEEYPFGGIFDGRGYKVYLDYTEASSATSLFGYLAEGGVVRNTTFVIKNMKVRSTSYGAIMNVNEGTVENCKVEFESLEIITGGMYSPLVKVNRGIIRNVVVDGTVTGAVAKEVEKDISYGSICVYNYGKIENSIVSVAYHNLYCTDAQNVYAYNAKNEGISAVSVENMASSEIENVSAIIGENVYVFDHNFSGISFYTDGSEVFTTNNIFDKYDFNNQIWQIANGTLKIKTMG